MLSIADFREVMLERMKDAAALYQKKRYVGSIYLCGYAIEISLKIRVLRLMDWSKYPEKINEFTPRFRFLKIHDLELLLAYSGVEATIKAGSGPYRTSWDVIAKWNPEERYNLAGINTKADALAVLRATQSLVEFLGPP